MVYERLVCTLGRKSAFSTLYFFTYCISVYILFRVSNKFSSTLPIIQAFLNSFYENTGCVLCFIYFSQHLTYNNLAALILQKLQQIH